MDLKLEVGIAGQVSVTTHVRMTSSGTEHVTGFVGSRYGSPGPVIMIMGHAQIVVVEPERFGQRFDAQWVRRFYDSDPADNHEFAHRHSPDDQACPNCGHYIRLHAHHAGCGVGNCVCSSTR
ncbi:hypothetical protein FDH86_gp100 [Arthrobacter phage Tank]|uniref:Uncharacterized protein n=1 Tax=Arthrobacter phage Tank TaxID=1772319 RepID=A0A0U4JV89_9CAUD|nr:hypothetical protein FDH86_gp100 [Arthrobacter phage Tank]ALY10635.1 hypothetical protein TANK_100 [Arthrobacter phage Tank]